MITSPAALYAGANPMIVHFAPHGSSIPGHIHSIFAIPSPNAYGKKVYTRYWNNYVRESNIGNMRIDRIKRVHIVELYKELLENKELATATVHTLHVIIYGCFEDLVQNNALQSNPAKKAFSRIGKRPAKKREPLTVKQQENFITFVSESPTYRVYLPMFSFFLGTGVRVSELMGLTWKDIDLFRDD